MNVCTKRGWQMNFNELSKYVENKYGLKFKPVIPGSTELYVLSSPLDGEYFAMLSRIKKDHAGLAGTGHIATLDLRCGDFSDMIRDLPGFTSAFRLKSNDWVGVWLDNGNAKAIKNALDYAFKVAMNDGQTNIANSQYIYVPGENSNEQYHEQKIRPRREVIRRNEQKQTPEKIQKMLESYDYSILPAKGREKNFYNQGRLMADYDDDYEEIVSFKRYYPTYHDMTVPQLRTYFAWRKKIRANEYQKISTSYAFVYIYELLNNIGVETPEIGFQKLVDFKNKYVEKFDPTIKQYLQGWLKDYALYYHLNRHTIDHVFSDEINEDKGYHILLNPEKYSAHEVGAVFVGLSSYMKACMSYKKKPAEFEKALLQVWLKIMALKDTAHVSFFNKYLAHRNLLVKQLFAGAVFYPRKKDVTSYVIDSERKYLYQDGKWYLEALYPVKRQKSELNTFLHEVDRLFRIRFHLGKPLKPRKLEKIYLDAIKEGILEYQRQLEEAKRPKVEIDFSNLKQIRADASVTRDSLLTDEEKALEIEEEKQEQDIQKTNPLVEKKNAPAETYGLDENELFFLIALLKKEAWHDYLKKHHLMASILADQINDKLFDEIGDAVIEFNEQNEPEIISDYQDDLKEMFLQE